MKKIAVIGCGLIGQGWAAVFAKAGFKVAMYDPSANAVRTAVDAMEKRISDLLDFGLIADNDKDNILKNIAPVFNIREALDKAIYVQESGPEILETKINITHELDKLTDENVPIGSSTSGISASRYCSSVPGKHRCLVVHPINPPHLHPAVELVPSQWTDQDTLLRVKDIMIQCDRETIVLQKEIDGFVVNRLQGALLEEAFRLIGNGIVSAKDLDKAICDGLGLRWSIMGPMQTIHLNAPGGVTDYVKRYSEMYRNFRSEGTPEVDWHIVADDKIKPEMHKEIPIEQITNAQVKRDRRLMALLRHKQEICN